MSELTRLNEAVAPHVARARGGDEQAFAELVQACRQQIYRWALVQTGDPDDAEDVTQEVLVRLHGGIRSYRSQSRFTTWLYQITRNAGLEHHRRLTRQERLLNRTRNSVLVLRPASADTETVDALSSQGVAALVRGFLTTLPQRQREVFDLVDLQDHAPSEVARMLGLNPITVRAHLHRARRALRARLLARHPELVEEWGS